MYNRLSDVRINKKKPRTARAVSTFRTTNPALVIHRFFHRYYRLASHYNINNIVFTNISQNIYLYYIVYVRVHITRPNVSRVAGININA